MPLFEGHKDSGIERLFIEMPDQFKNQVIWKYPDAQIMQHSTVNVDVDYVAIFTNLGRVIGVLPPGRHTLSEGASVAFGWLVDRLTGNGYYDAELYYVATRDILGLPFGGPVDNLQDGPTGLVVSVRVFGELGYRVCDPPTLLVKLAGSSGDFDHNQQIATWIEEQTLAAIRAVLPDITAGHGVLAMGQLQDVTAQAAIAKANTVLPSWGLAIIGFAELNVNLPDEDATQLKMLAATKAYTGMAGSFNDAVRAEAALEIAHGVAAGNVGAQEGLVSGLLLGVQGGAGVAGFGGGGGAAAPPPPYSAPPGAAPAAPGGRAPGAPGAAAATEQDHFCANCGRALGQGTHFCPRCGSATSA
ncbi:MAG TPA: SPFH domain-containing protein [Acidimicrobiales bacterium]|nr:SPFH domain-containing protein [Acidimicrobiales bacterium]